MVMAFGTTSFVYYMAIVQKVIWQEQNQLPA